ncbi:MAG: 4Fe-4S dicluster domain-containing protein [Chloroflexota bacterium]
MPLEMLGNVLSNVFSRPATRRYPYETREPFADARGQIKFDMTQCIYCGACSRRCPAAAITVSRPDKTLTFEPFRCIICEACIEVCPKKCIDSEAQYRSPAYTKSVEVYTTPVKPAAEEAAAKA